MSEHVIIGSWERPEKPPACGSSLAHQGCKFAVDGMACAASREAYDACPYHQKGGTVAVYPLPSLTLSRRRKRGQGAKV